MSKKKNLSEIPQEALSEILRTLANRIWELELSGLEQNLQLIELVIEGLAEHFENGANTLTQNESSSIWNSAYEKSRL